MNTSNLKNYKPKEFAELLNVSVKTLQRWDRENILNAHRTPTDRRYYTYDQYLQFKGITNAKDERQNVSWVLNRLFVTTSMAMSASLIVSSVLRVRNAPMAPSSSMPAVSISTSEATPGSS